MNKLLVALALTAVLATPALAAISKGRAETRTSPCCVDLQASVERRGTVGRSTSDYWQPCDLTFDACIVNNCD